MLRLIIWLLLNFFNCLFFAPVACSISTSSGSRRRRWERGCHFHLPLSFPSRHFLSYNKFVVDEAVWSQLCCFCFTLRFNYSKASFYKCLLLLLNKKKSDCIDCWSLGKVLKFYKRTQQETKPSIHIFSATSTRFTRWVWACSVRTFSKDFSNEHSEETQSGVLK